MTNLFLKTKYCNLHYSSSRLVSWVDLEFKDYTNYLDSSTVTTVDVNEISSEFVCIVDELSTPKFRYCWQAGDYLITLHSEENTVTVKVYYKDENGWRSSEVNNANFLYDIWMLFWQVEALAECWHELQRGMPSDWELTDTPITVEKLAKELYNYSDWVKELTKDRQSREWDLTNN
jgi:hypothetical protein